MKLRELEKWLSQCDQFEDPKVVYEQYATSAHIAARMLYSAQDNIEGKNNFGILTNRESMSRVVMHLCCCYFRLSGLRSWIWLWDFVDRKCISRSSVCLWN